MFFVGAYWRPRAEPAGRCAERLGKCLTAIGAAHPLLRTWFRKGRRGSGPVALTPESLEALLSAGRNRTDTTGAVIPELGFTAALWNGDDPPASFSTTCGATPTTPYVMNHFALQLPGPDEGTAAELYAARTARTMFCAAVAAWSPDWATFASDTMRAAQVGSSGGRVAGWMTYLRDVPELPVVAPGISVEPFGDGILITAGTDPLHVEDEAIAGLRAYLDRTR